MYTIPNVVGWSGTAGMVGWGAVALLCLVRLVCVTFCVEEVWQRGSLRTCVCVCVCVFVSARGKGRERVRKGRS